MVTRAVAPIVPEDRNSRSARHALGRALSRAMASVLLGGTTNRSPQEVLRARGWGDDFMASMITKAATSPTSLTNAPALTHIGVSDLLLGLAPQSAAIRLFDIAGLQLDFHSATSYRIPYVATRPAGIFVGEGQPIPVLQPSLNAITLGPPRKIAFVITATEELLSMSGEGVADLLGRMMGETAALNLDTYTFDSNPSDGTRPAGLVFNVTPLTATPTGTIGIDVIGTDIANLAAAMAAGAVNPEGIVLVCIRASS
jgi:hypothetical protein